MKDKISTRLKRKNNEVFKIKKNIRNFSKIIAICKYLDGGKFRRNLKTIYDPQYLFMKRKDEKKIDNTIFIYEVKWVFKKMKIENKSGRKVTRILKIPFAEWYQHQKDKQGKKWLATGWKKYDKNEERVMNNKIKLSRKRRYGDK